MNSVEPVSLIPDQLLDVLKFLADKGSIRQLDYQFARFIAQQATSHSQEIGFLAGVVSHELGKGHICTQLIQQHTKAQTKSNTDRLCSVTWLYTVKLPCN